MKSENQCWNGHGLAAAILHLSLATGIGIIEIEMGLNRGVMVK